MKNFFKIFFTVVCFFIPIFAGAAGINQFALETQTLPAIEAISTTKQESLYLNIDTKETDIVTANSRNLEFSSIQDRKNSQNTGNIDKSSSQNKLLQQIFTANYNKLYYSTSHKISSYLKNEICTRAP